ncbi:MAG: DMT family transporter [Candidatus Sigynarchaeota archaeon]
MKITLAHHDKKQQAWRTWYVRRRLFKVFARFSGVICIATSRARGAILFGRQRFLTVNCKKRLPSVTEKKGGHARSIIFLVFAAFFWAFPPALGKFVVFDVSPFFVTAFRLLCAALMFFPFIFTRESRKKLKKLNRKTISWLLISGGVFFGPHYVFYFVSLQWTPAIHVSVLLQTGYLFSAVFCIKYLKESWTKHIIAGLLLSMAGVVIIMLAYPGQDGTAYTPISILIGDTLILVSMLLWAIYSVINKKILDSVGEVPSIVFNFIFGALVVLPFSIDGFVALPSLDAIVVLALLLIALFGSALGYLFYNLGLKNTSGARANIILLTNPVFGVIISMILVKGEPLTAGFVIGAALVIASLYLVNRENESTRSGKTSDCIISPQIEPPGSIS